MIRRSREESKVLCWCCWSWRWRWPHLDAPHNSSASGSAQEQSAPRERRGYPGRPQQPADPTLPLPSVLQQRERGRDWERVCERGMERKRERLTNLSIPSDAWPQIQSGQRGGWCHHEYRTSVDYAMFDTFGSHALGFSMSEIMSYFTLVETGTSGLRRATQKSWSSSGGLSPC